MRYLSGLALVVAASLLPALAAGASLPPFSAEYRIYVNKIPTPIKADLVLEPASGEDRYHNFPGTAIVFRNVSLFAVLT